MKGWRFHWDPWNTESATKHGYTEDQIESVFDGRFWHRKSKGEYYDVLGVDQDGHYLELAFEFTPEGLVRVFHCDKMKHWQKRLYLRQTKR